MCAKVKLFFEQNKFFIEKKNGKEMKAFNVALVMKTYNELKDTEAFQAKGKTTKIYAIAAESGLSHVTVEKVLKNNSIEL